MQFDPRPLTEPVDRNAVRAWSRTAGVPTFSISGTGGTGANVGLVIGLGFFVLMFLSVAGTMITIVTRVISSGGNMGWPFLGVFLLMAGLLVFGIVGTVRSGLGRRNRAYRLNAFAQANGMSYKYSVIAPPLPGMIFHRGSGQMATDLVRGEKPRFVEFGNYQYTTGSGKSRTTHKWGYVAIKLDVPLPHIVLDARGNNSMLGSNLPLALNRDQRLRLEGDFNEYFDLYCPTGYEADALYLFTPDIMARFIDNAAQLDVEIVDDWIFFYSKREFSTLDPATWAWLFSAVRALLDKFAQWSRWRDDRLRVDRLRADRLQAEQAAMDAAARGLVAGPAPAGGAPTVPASVDAAAVAASAQAAAHALPIDPAAAMLRPPPGVAHQGRRLRSGAPWKLLIVLGILVGGWLLFTSGIFGTFFSVLLGVIG